jgi:hypothetical protein
MLKGPFTQGEFDAINKKSANRLRCNGPKPYHDVYILTGDKDLAPFGRKIVTGFSSIAMGLLTWAGVMNFIR